MSRHSPTIARVIAVLDFFIEHPRQAFSVTQVTKSLGLSRTTVAPILAGFVEEGYIYRRADRSYVLGRALQSMAEDSGQPVSPLAVASQEMRTLADELAVVAAALFIEDGEVVVRERAASVHHLGWVNLMMARRYPMRPWGLLMQFSDPRFEARLEAVSPPLSADERANMLSGMAFARQHGFSPLFVPKGERREDYRSQLSDRFLSEIDLEERYQLRAITAPVMGSGATVAFAIALSGFPHPMKGSEVMDAGRQLRAACQRITAFLIGRPLNTL